MQADERPGEYPEPENFAEALERLETLAEKMEAGELPLEEAMETYEEGLYLIRFCEQRLEEAELLVEEVDESDPPDTGPIERDSPEA